MSLRWPSRLARSVGLSTRLVTFKSHRGLDDIHWRITPFQSGQAGCRASVHLCIFVNV